MVSGDYAPGKEGFVSVQDGRIHYEVKGTGKTLVLIHSAVSDSRSWDSMFDFFSSAWTVVRYDVRGLGKSSAAKQDYRDCEDLHILLSSLGLTNVSIVAASNSGRIALDYAFNFPGQVERIVLAGSGLGLFDPAGNGEAESQAADFASRFSHIDSLYGQGKKEEALDGLMELFAGKTAGTDRELARTVMNENLSEIINDESASHARYDVGEGELVGIRVPVLVLVGEQDHPIIKWSSEKLAETLPQSTLRVLADGDHFPGLSAGEQFRDVVVEFLDQ